MTVKKILWQLRRFENIKKVLNKAKTISNSVKKTIDSQEKVKTVKEDDEECLRPVQNVSEHFRTSEKGSESLRKVKKFEGGSTENFQKCLKTVKKIWKRLKRFQND